MSADSSQDVLWAALQQYMQETDFAHLTDIDQPDLSTLFSDLAGLKTEVKVESRQFKATLDILTGAVEQLKTDNRVLVEQLAVMVDHMQQQRIEIERALLLEWLDVYDRLSEGNKALQNYRPINALFNHSKKHDVRFIQSLAQGQEIMLQRVEQSLTRRKVVAIDCVGKPFDAQRMHTIAIAREPTLDSGIVVEELRKGFMFEDRVLRLAEVKVNKL